MKLIFNENSYFCRDLHSSELRGQFVLREVRSDRDGEILHAQVLREVLLPILHRGRPATPLRPSPGQFEEEAQVHHEEPRLRTLGCFR